MRKTKETHLNIAAMKRYKDPLMADAHSMCRAYPECDDCPACDRDCRIPFGLLFNDKDFVEKNEEIVREWVAHNPVGGVKAP